MLACPDPSKEERIARRRTSLREKKKPTLSQAVEPQMTHQDFSIRPMQVIAFVRKNRTPKKMTRGKIEKDGFFSFLFSLSDFSLVVCVRTPPAKSGRRSAHVDRGFYPRTKSGPPQIVFFCPQV